MEQGNIFVLAIRFCVLYCLFAALQQALDDEIQIQQSMNDVLL